MTIFDAVILVAVVGFVWLLWKEWYNPATFHINDATLQVRAITLGRDAWIRSVDSSTGAMALDVKGSVAMNWEPGNLVMLAQGPVTTRHYVTKVRGRGQAAVLVNVGPVQP